MDYQIYFKRQKELRGEVHDVFQYERLPNPLRIQIKFILDGLLGDGGDHHYNPEVKATYTYIYDLLREELGVFDINHRNVKFEKPNINSYEELSYFLINEKDTELVLSLVEVSFRVAEICTTDYSYRNKHLNEAMETGLKVLNNRFKENGVGFAFEESQLIKIDSQLMHQEVVKPALKLLNAADYNIVQNSYLNAYEHYIQKKYNEALIDCNKAFESTMKVICGKQSWGLKGNETANKLIDICLKNNLIPNYWQTQLSSLRSMLESAIPTARNKYAHGPEIVQQQAPEELVGYILHTTASTIIFLIESEKKLN